MGHRNFARPIPTSAALSAVAWLTAVGPTAAGARRSNVPGAAGVPSPAPTSEGAATAGVAFVDVRRAGSPAGVMVGGRWLSRDELQRRLGELPPEPK